MLLLLGFLPAGESPGDRDRLLSGLLDLRDASSLSLETVRRARLGGGDLESLLLDDGDARRPRRGGGGDERE